MYELRVRESETAQFALVHEPLQRGAFLQEPACADRVCVSVGRQTGSDHGGKFGRA